MHNQSENIKIKSVAVMTSGSDWELLRGICYRLKHDYGADIHFYAISEKNIEFYKQSDKENLISSYTRAAMLRDYSTQKVAAEDRLAIVNLARKNEEKYKFLYNWLVVANRHLGRGFALAGFHHPRSVMSEKSDYWSVLNAYNQEFAFWEKELKEKNINLFLQTSLESAAFSGAKNIPYRILCGAKYKNLHYWGYNEYYESPLTEEILKSLGNEDQAIVDLDTPFLHEQEHRLVFEKTETLYHVFKKSFFAIAQYINACLRNYELNRNYYLRDILAYHWRRWRDLQKLSKNDRPRLANLKGKPFVFFPLHTEPESAVHRMSPEYFFQHAAIAAIARDLPAGVPLVVKETIHGVGRRPDNFYDAIIDIKNVIFLNVLEKGLDIVKEASAVATITGTAGFEAAVLGCPVLSFGQHNRYNCAPHVYVIRSFDEIKKYLSHILSDKFDKEQAKRDGAKFLSAIQRSSFDLENYSFYKKQTLRSQTVDAAYNALIHTLMPRKS